MAFAGLSQKLVTTTSAKVVMAFGMALIGGGILWATQIPADGNFWHDLAGPFFVAGMGTAFAFIPVSIGALAGVTSATPAWPRACSTPPSSWAAPSASLVASIAASRFHTLVHHGYSSAAALTGGFSSALWVCGLFGLLAVPVVFVLVRRTEITKAGEPPVQPNHEIPQGAAPNPPAG